MNKVLVIGSGGAGKSTLSRKLGERTGLPVIHLDTIFWRPGWDPIPPDEWQAVTTRLLAQEAWILDGNYGSTMDQRLAVSDAVIFMDLPRRICLWRVVKRRFQHIGESRPDMAPGCPERLLDGGFFKFIKWIWDYPRVNRRPLMERLQELQPSTAIITLRNSREVRDFLDDPKGTNSLA